MPNKQSTANAQLPDRLYGEHYPDSFLDVPRPIRQSSTTTLGDYIRHLQKVSKQSDKPCVACEPNKSGESTYDHICPNNPILTCNCTDPKFCAELGNDPDGNSTSEDRCPDHDGFSDNIEYTGIPYPKGKATVSGWPCVVVGAVCEAWTTATECVSRSEHSAGDTERHIDARKESDGTDKSAQL